MKIALLATGPQEEVIAALKEKFPTATIVFCDLASKDYNLNTALKGADAAVNLISATKPDKVEILQLDEEANLKDELAEVSLNMVAAFSIVDTLDLVAEALKENKTKVVLNLGYPADLITLYLYKAHNITSFVPSLQANGLLQDFLSATKMDNIKDASFSAAGRVGNIWLTQVKDKKGNDLLAQARKGASSTPLNLSRHMLICNALASLAFYGYYHSADTPLEDKSVAIATAIECIFGEGKTTVYLGTINNGAIPDFDSEALIEVACECGAGKIAVLKTSLPLPCALALNDYISAIGVAAVALSKRSQTLFKRAVKLDPYLSGILSLKELEEYARGLISFYELEKVFSKEAV